MKNKKVILSSILSLVLCLSLIAGGTFALFTSDATTNIAVTSGTVNVSAELSVDDFYSPTKLDMDGVIVESADAATDTTFANGGSVVLDGAEIKINNMTPGDKVVFKVTITNSTNVAFQQRMVFGMTGGDADFFDQLLVGISDDGADYTYYSDFATPWENGTPVETGATDVSYKYVSIEMPGFVDNKWQNTACTLTLNISAVQGNANVSDEAIEKVIHVVSAAEVADAIANAEDGAIIFLNEPADTLEIAYSDAKTVFLRGYRIGELTVNAPAGTLHVYNNVGTIYGDYIAHNSLHVWGDVENVIMKSGRVVVENTAYINTVTLDPIENETAKISIPTTDGETGTVERIVVEEIAEGAAAYVIAPEDTVVEGDGKKDATVLLGGSEDSFVAESDEKILYIGDETGLRELAKKVNAGTTYAGWQVLLTDNIDLEYKEWTPIGTSAHPFMGNFDGQGHTISNLYICKEVGNIGTSNRQGLFGTIKPSGATYFQNLTLHNADVTGGYHVGAVIATSDGSSQSATGNYLVVTNIQLTGLVKVYGWEGVAGVMGSGNMAEISNITVNVEEGSYVTTMPDGRTNSFACVGSVKGGGYLAKVDNITSNMDVTAKTAGTGGLFGVIGGQTVDCYLSNLSYTGKVTLTESSVDKTGGYQNYQYNGLLVGAPRFNLIADQATCTSTGTLELHTEDDVIFTTNGMDSVFTWGVDLFGASRDYTYTNKSYAVAYVSAE